MTKAENELEVLVDALVEDLLKTVDALPEAAMPFGAKKLSREEQMERYRAMRDDPQEWELLLAERGYPSTVKYAVMMEKRHQAEVEE